MSYLRKFEYTIIPKDSYAVLHNCGGCGCKARFINTKRFRVNANGNRLDVWLIYQCEKCRHTLNLSIYERMGKSRIPSDEYQRYLQNDEALALKKGRDYSFFVKNRMEVDWEKVSYELLDMQKGTDCLMQCEEDMRFLQGDEIHVHNPYAVRVRAEKVAGQLLRLSRSQLKKQLERQQIVIEQEGTGWQIRLVGYEN